MRRLSWLLLALAELIGCDDGASTEAKDAAVDAVVDAGADASPDAAPDVGPLTAPDCAALCRTYQTLCFDAYAIRDCDDCAAVAEGFGDAPHTRAAAACAVGLKEQDCRGLYACLSDDDGLTSLSQRARVEITGTAFGVDQSALDSAAWAVVGAKGDGDPGDLEVFFFDDADFKVLRFDDLGALSGEVDAALHPVELEGMDKLTLSRGTIQVRQWAADGDFQVEALLSTANRPDEALAVRVSGAFTEP